MNKDKQECKKNETIVSICQDCGYTEYRDLDGCTCPNCDGEMHTSETAN